GPEGAAACAAGQHAALSHPEVAFKMLREERQDLITPGDGDLQSAVYAVLGREMALGFLPCKGSGEGLQVEGFVSRPSCCRGTRGYQHFFVNGRYVKSRTMTAALEEAYQNQKMVGRFPGCVLHITSSLNAVDVNVHPTKTEVKFTNEKRLFQAVYASVKAALNGEQGHPQVQLEEKRPQPNPMDTVTPNQTFFQTMTAEEYRAKGPVLPLRDSGGTYAAPAAPARPVPPPVKIQPKPYSPSAAEEFRGLDLPILTERPARRTDTSATVQKKEHPTPPKAVPAPVEEVPPVPAEETVPNPPEPPTEALEPEPLTPEIPAWRLAGEVLDTYIIVEQGDTVYFIDKHAAHERMNFDKLKARDYQPMRQMLLTPVVFTPPPEEGAALLAHLELLNRYGFEVEDFGGGALLVRQSPDYLSAGEIEPTLTQLGERLLVTGTADPSAARDEVLHTMACKAAIKGGWKSGREELEAVAQAVMSGEVKYCPHGRPVAIELTKKQLEKQFKRT
ncbi:MAG: DNA mismatch repair endonuclease MutL, partial [Clostridiales bacterium]|nr:DNA mismatch repair endonuclease MutL [Clostridiales bacterium]